MLTLRQIAQYLGKDDRTARKWVAEKNLPRFNLNGLNVYAARDVAKAICGSKV